MGLFDAFKKKEPATAPRPGGLLGAVIERHKMEKAKPPTGSGLAGEWWEQPPDDDLLVAAMARGDKLVVFLGEPVEITDIYLVREGAGFRLGAGNEMDFPELRRPAMREALARLSGAVEEVQVYETRDGLSLQFGAGATLEQVEADLAVARDVLNAAGRQ